MLPKVSLIQRMTESGIIAVIRRVPKDRIPPLVESLIKGGVTALEITVDSPGVYSVLRKVSEVIGERAVIGAGTVIDATSAERAIESGAEFLFSPSLHPDVIRVALRHGKVAVPGVMTPTEMIMALEYGADMVKIFPAGVLGPKYIRDILAPFPQIPVIPTGGINLENVASFIEAGAAAVGIGGELVDRRSVETSDFERIARTAELYVEAIGKKRTPIGERNRTR
ncbi:2-dehydro-3-deoxy-phosphogluconate aldolase [Marinithermofilum abyssi]|uniref:2-dehydro-3-deoxy-phosphogluconate aldolase n=1 Tax=Marinithermofilum abyssi TaxID=1571185 RepID=A0A8J2VIL7_9BACL|nr:bifunctional 4-hydroxy-2-oxoglutarate aldolase/2-dehydro-3-deoxy-phosphogluconate aldolase [Marinithermofilum abyssi]GGE24448.1 2-dehydro-3-deoxy-phosphogluconate aldolase [Marinithermofilum abyssi]